MTDLSEGEDRDVVVDRAWTGLDHETAVRMSGRPYRPARLYDRPQESERQSAGKQAKVRGAQRARPENPNRAQSDRAVTACPGSRGRHANGDEG